MPRVYGIYANISFVANKTQHTFVRRLNLKPKPTSNYYLYLKKSIQNGHFLKNFLLPLPVEEVAGSQVVNTKINKILDPETMNEYTDDVVIHNR